MSVLKQMVPSVTRVIAEIRSWKYEAVQVAMRLIYLPAICFECIAVMPSEKIGKRRSDELKCHETGGFVGILNISGEEAYKFLEV